MLIERRTSLHRKLQEENLTTVTVTQPQDTIEKGCRFKTCLIFMISSRREVTAR
jgi:hypothetical protein